jgi:hypothetical protein
MTDRSKDPTGTQPTTVGDSGRAGATDPGRGREPGDGLSRSARAADADGRSTEARGDVDDTEREVITGGTAATSEVGDPAAQEAAEQRQGGPPQRRG